MICKKFAAAQGQQQIEYGAKTDTKGTFFVVFYFIHIQCIDNYSGLLGIRKMF